MDFRFSLSSVNYKCRLNKTLPCLKATSKRNEAFCSTSYTPLEVVREIKPDGCVKRQTANGKNETCRLSSAVCKVK